MLIVVCRLPVGTWQESVIYRTQRADFAKNGQNPSVKPKTYEILTKPARWVREIPLFYMTPTGRLQTTISV